MNVFFDVHNKKFPDTLKNSLIYNSSLAVYKMVNLPTLSTSHFKVGNDKVGIDEVGID